MLKLNLQYFGYLIQRSDSGKSKVAHLGSSESPDMCHCGQNQAALWLQLTLSSMAKVPPPLGPTLL